MKSLHQVTRDAIALRGIVDFLAFPATSHELEMTQHLGHDTANRLCKILQNASIIEHPIVTRIILGASQQVPQIHEWKLTSAYRAGEVKFDPEKLAGAV